MDAPSKEKFAAQDDRPVGTVRTHKASRWVVWATFIALSLSTPMARAGDLYQDTGSWLQLYGEGSLKFVHPELENWRIWLEAQARLNNDWQQWYQGILRAALGYSLSDRATIWIGYTWVPTHPAGPSVYISEQEVLAAFRYIAPTTWGTFTFRTMMDVDFLRGDEPRFRPRQLIRFLRPFGVEPRLSLVVWDEVLVRANSTPSGGAAGFDQNRVFLGLGWSFSPDIRTELGYMNQYIDDAKHVNNIMQHLVMGSLFVSF